MKGEEGKGGSGGIPPPRAHPPCLAQPPRAPPPLLAPDVAFRVQCSVFRMRDAVCRVEGAWFSVQSSDFRMRGAGCRVEGCGLKGVEG